MGLRVAKEPIPILAFPLKGKGRQIKLKKLKGSRLELNPAKPLAPNSPGEQQTQNPAPHKEAGFFFILFPPRAIACYVKFAGWAAFYVPIKIPCRFVVDWLL